MSQVLWILTVLLSHWRRHPMQFATLLIGLVSATALWSGVQALNQQARSSYDRAAATLGGARTAMLVGRDRSTFPQQLFLDLRRAGWSVSPLLEGRVQIGGRSVRLLGIEPVTLPTEATSTPEIGRAGLQSFLSTPGETVVAPETLSELGLGEGASPSVDGASTLPPLKVATQLLPGVLVVDIGIAQRILKMPDQISRLLIGKTKGVRRPLEEVVGDKLRLVEPDAESDLERLTDSFHLNLTAFGMLSFLVGLFIVNSAIGLAFEQRLPMLRTLRACGVSLRLLNTVLLLELVTLALLAGIVGLVCGYFIAAALLPDVAASLRGLYGAQIPGQLTLKPEWWIAGLAISVIGALAAGTTSLLKAIRLPILATAQLHAWQRAQQRWLLLQGVLALAGVTAAALFLTLGDLLISGFAVLASLLLSAALGLPVILGFVLTLGERGSNRALTKWFWADSQQQLSGLSLALMALLLALAVNVGVSTMVESFSRTFTGWLDGRLAADVYLNASDNTQAAEIKAWLSQRPEVEAMLPSGRAEVQIQGWPVEILGLADQATYRDRWPLLQSRADAWDTLRDGNGALISEQLARRFKLDLGGRITLPATGSEWPLEVVGIYADYGNPKGQAAVNIEALVQRFPEDSANSIGAAGRLIRDTVACRRDPKQIRSRQPQPFRSGHAESGVDADFQPHLRRDGRAEYFHARSCRHCVADKPAHAEQFAIAATGAAMGDRDHPASARCHRTSEDNVGGADHLPAGAAVGIAGGMVPDRSGECKSLRLAAAVSCISAAASRTIGRRHACGLSRGAASGPEAGAHAARQAGQDFRQ